MFQRDVRLESFLLRVFLDAVMTPEPRDSVTLVLLVPQLVAAVLVRLHLTYGAHVFLLGHLAPGVVLVATVTVFDLRGPYGICVAVFLNILGDTMFAFKLQPLKQAPGERDASF